MNSTSTIRKLARIVLGLMLLFTGAGHLTWARKEFTAQVPRWIPLNIDFVVIASGFAELAIGLGLIFLVRRQHRIGWIAAIFFIAIFPGNIAQWVNHRDAFGLNSDFARLVRLFFQPLLVVWALWATGVWPRKSLPTKTKAYDTST